VIALHSIELDYFRVMWDSPSKAYATEWQSPLETSCAPRFISYYFA